MKKNYFLILISIISILQTVKAQHYPTIQSYQTVYTAKVSSVQGIIFYPLHSSDYAAAENYMNSNYSNTILVENPTSEYNCHGFAFHLSEGNTNKVWINNTGSNLSNYWTDGSFIEVCNESDADKAYYYAGDHSAKTTSSVSGWYESKWGANRRVVHAPTDCPYDVGLYRRQYYASTKISGDISTPICSDTRTFSVKNITNATYTWSTSSNLSYTGSGNQVAVQRSNNVDGPAWIEVTISTLCSTSSATTRVDLFAGIPAPDPIQGPSTLCPGDVDHFSIPAVTGASYNWDMDYELELASYTTPAINQIFVRAKPGFTGGYVYLTLSNPCGASGRISYWVGMGSSCSYSYSYSPNPANTELNITYTEPSSTMLTNTTAPSTEIKKQFEVVLFNEKAEKLRAAKNNGSTNIKLDIQDIPDGTYYLHITDGKKVIRKQVIIRH